MWRGGVSLQYVYDQGTQHDTETHTHTHKHTWDKDTQRDREGMARAAPLGQGPTHRTGAAALSILHLAA